MLDKNATVYDQVATQGWIVQERLATGEKKFGDLEGPRMGEPQPQAENTTGINLKPEQKPQHPLLSQSPQFSGEDPADARVPANNDDPAVEEAYVEALAEQCANNPTLALTLSNNLQLQIELYNQKKHQPSMIPKPPTSPY